MAHSHPSAIQNSNSARQNLSTSSCPFLTVGHPPLLWDFSWQGTHRQSWVLSPSFSTGNIHPQLPSGPAVFTCEGAGCPMWHLGQPLWARLLSLSPAPCLTPMTAVSFHPSLTLLLPPSLLSFTSSPSPFPEPPACALPRPGSLSRFSHPFLSFSHCELPQPPLTPRPGGGTRSHRAPWGTPGDPLTSGEGLRWFLGARMPFLSIQRRFPRPVSTH